MGQKFVRIVTLTTAWLGVLASAASAQICTIGQQGEALWQGDWYPVTVLDVSGDSCYISYDGYDSSWNEWVDGSRFLASFYIGQSVHVLWRGEWYLGQILDISGNSYYITYDGYDSSWNEWVESARLSP